ncbi:hypothetical protein Thal_1250 [Thermocrinis albus DSM 14484]|uniref:Uncharacterized protein n=1 Tax=Thermocrinis albus (strain DSM 14484 / JCM 11386 / HI 11/12) TaxID=638303 RepID=D3SMA2_THEAH|nr:hypothetical protein [Thermocrinis albus]ADC89882.1 hypothetical protein Thal_1250 [Thermocrinis albus DSM 14484]
MRSWSYLIQLRGYTERGEAKEASALYVVSVPMDENILKATGMECYATHYLPPSAAVLQGMAYAVGIDRVLQNPEEYRIMGYREDMDLYIFKEGVTFKEGLVEVFRLLLEELSSQGVVEVMPVLDVGSPPEDVMMECLQKALSA